MTRVPNDSGQCYILTGSDDHVHFAHIETNAVKTLRKLTSKVRKSENATVAMKLIDVHVYFAQLQ